MSQEDGHFSVSGKKVKGYGYIDGDIRKIRYVLYNCSASHPKIEGRTNEENLEVQTETLAIKARPLASGYVKAKTGKDWDEGG